MNRGHHRSVYADDPSMRELIAEFVVRLEAHVRSIRAYRSAENTQDLRRLMHQLKGSGMSYGFPPISSHASAAEESVATGHPLPAADAHLTALINYIEHIEDYAQ